ncbi:hypothetical protein AB0M83_27055 [Amycolatopsis sp. NPDC051106]|uniref:hypothetical protein n=1 Tax=unclassified Amycolatopsis TaxID=2618356 RepID=UPI003426B4B8
MRLFGSRVLRDAEEQAIRLELELNRDPDAERSAAFRTATEHSVTTTLVALEEMRADIAAKRRLDSSAKSKLNHNQHVAAKLHYLRAMLCPTGTTDDEADLASAVILLAPLPLHWRAGLPDGLTALVGAETDVRAQLELSARLLNAIQFDDRFLLVDALVTVQESVLASLPAAAPERPAVLSNLGLALVNRFRRGGLPADLDRAMPLHREALALMPADGPDRAAVHGNIANVLREQFHLHKRIADLDEAIAEMRIAASADRADVPIMLSNLCDALRARFEHTGKTEDLSQAVSIGRQAVATTPPGHRNRSAATYHLALALLHHSSHGGSVAAINQALALAEESVECGGPLHPNHTSHQVLLDSLRELAVEFTDKLRGTRR